MKRKWVIVAAVVLTLCVDGVRAQDEESKGQLFVIGEDVVKPSMVDQYEAAVKELMAAMKTHELAVPYMQASMREDFHYYYLIPIESLGDIEKIDNAFGEVVQKIGQEKWKVLFAPFGEMLEYEKHVIAERADYLSYTPETPRIKPEERNFLHWTFYYIQYGKAEEATQIAKDYLKLFKSKNVPNGYHVYWGRTGIEMPALAVVQWAKDATDFYEQAKRSNELLGEEGKKLSKRAMAITRRIEHVSGWPRPDLSYMPETGGTN